MSQVQLGGWCSFACLCLGVQGASDLQPSRPKRQAAPRRIKLSQTSTHRAAQNLFGASLQLLTRLQLCKSRTESWCIPPLKQANGSFPALVPGLRHEDVQFFLGPLCASKSPGWKNHKCRGQPLPRPSAGTRFSEMGSDASRRPTQGFTSARGVTTSVSASSCRETLPLAHFALKHTFAIGGAITWEGGTGGGTGEEGGVRGKGS